MKNISFGNRKLMWTGSALLALALFGAACGKKPSIPAPPPPPTGGSAAPTPTSTAPGAPTATLTAEPSSIQIGQSATLSWTTTNASEITISNGIGTVSATGRQSVSPSETTTYNLTAIGSNGTATARGNRHPIAPAAAAGSRAGATFEQSQATLPNRACSPS